MLEIYLFLGISICLKCLKILFENSFLRTDFKVSFILFFKIKVYFWEHTLNLNYFIFISSIIDEN